MIEGPVLVLGAHGQLGAAVVEALGGRDVLSPPRGTLDITSPEQVSRMVRDAAPAVIVNCAAFNDVDGAEDHPSAALDVNACAVRSLARAAEACRATLVHYSTDFVFDGTSTEPYTEDAQASPAGVYAMSKLAGEWFALEAPGAFVLRVESLFGTPRGWTGRVGTLEGIVAGIVDGREVRVFTDRVVSPSSVADVAAATLHLVDSAAAPGLYHCVNSGHATWFEVADEAARQLGVPARLVPVSVDDVTLRAPRPRFCALSNAKLAAAGFAMPTWQEALARWLAARQRPIE